MNEGTGEPAPAAGLQFDKAEHTSEAAARVCTLCKRPLSLEYFEVAGNVICPSCADEIQHGKGGAPLLRAALFGCGAALVSTVLWYVIVKLTDREWGLVAIAVGLFVGFAVRRGSQVAGGWRYQALAMALTYVSITGSRVPLIVDGLQQAGEIVQSWGVVVALAFASPFLVGTDGILDLIIIGIGLYEAWKLNRRVPVNGPFRFGIAPATS